MTFAKILLIAALFALPLQAQTPGVDDSNISDVEDMKRFWQLSLPDGHFMVALDRIASISRSSYILDGNLLVTEVTIDTVGNALCRIYHLVPVAENGASSAAKRVTGRLDEVGERVGELTGADPNAVQKYFPTTTHAKTIEYRVADRASLDALYGSLTIAWSQGKGRRFAIAK